MKAPHNLLIGLCFLLLLVASASAAVTVSKTELLVEADYALFSDDNQKTIRAPLESFTLTNTETEAVTLSYTLTGLPNGYSAETKSVTLAAGATSDTLALNVDIPHSSDSGKTSIGTLTVTQAGTSVASIPVKQETLPMLELDRVEIEFTDENGEIQTSRFSETETTYKIDEKMLVGTILKMTFKVKNLFDHDYDENSRDIDGIELTLNPSESELFTEKNVEDEIYDIGTLDANENKEQEIVLNINPDADVDEYTVDIQLEGEDGEGAKHTLERELKFEIMRKRDDIRITKAEVQPTTLSCGREITLDVELKNFGAREQVFAGLLIFDKELGIKKNVTDLKLKEYGETDNVFNRQFKFIIPEDAEKGVHYLDVTAFVKRDVDTDSKRVPFTISACVAEEIPENIQQQNVPQAGIQLPVGDSQNTADKDKNLEKNEEVKSGEEVSGNEISKSDVVKTVERKPLSSRQLWIGGLVAVILLIVAIDALLIALLMKKR